MARHGARDRLPIGPRSVVTMTLAGDHRVTDGHAGALFLAEIGRLLQEPKKL